MAKSDDSLRVLHSVTGNATFCGPCALSALTGLSSDTWPDEHIQWLPWAECLKRVARVERQLLCLPAEYTFNLSDFCWPGLWGLCVNTTDETNPHVLACSYSDAPWPRTLLVDNQFRKPRSKTHCFRVDPLYRRFVVYGAVELGTPAPA